MKVFILKEGKEYNQGVAYLDDGTMVVVDNARKMISKTIDIVVTSVLQTTAGKMIFGRYIDAAAPTAQRRSGARAHRRTRAPERVGPQPAPRRRADADLRIEFEFEFDRVLPMQRVRTIDPNSKFQFLIPDRASVSLVADGLLSDPRHHASTRSCSARRRSCRACSIGAATSRTRCARAWSWLILKTTGVRVRGRGARAHHAGHDLRLRLEPPEHLRHAGDLRVAAVSAADHRQGIAGEVSGARLAPAARRAPVRRSPASRSRRHPAPLARAGVRGAVADHLRRRDAQP